jgi:hypothetical protein
MHDLTPLSSFRCAIVLEGYKIWRGGIAPRRETYVHAGDRRGEPGRIERMALTGLVRAHQRHVFRRNKRNRDPMPSASRVSKLGRGFSNPSSSTLERSVTSQSAPVIPRSVERLVSRLIVDPTGRLSQPRHTLNPLLPTPIS